MLIEERVCAKSTLSTTWTGQKNQASAVKSQQLNAGVMARIQEVVLWEFYVD
jgi:hypothetical protein